MKPLLRGRKPKLNGEVQARLDAWGALGTNKSEVAMNLGVSRTTVNNYLQKRHKAPIRDEDEL